MSQDKKPRAARIKREPLELMDVVLVDEDEFASMIQEGIFKHGMGLAAWLKYCMKRGRI